MAVLNRAHREVYGEKAVEFSYIALGGLVFTQLFTGKEVSVPIVLFGVVLFIFGLVVSYFLLKGLREGDKR